VRTLSRFSLLVLCACAALAAAATGASAATLLERDVPTAGAQPRNIILGPDGNLWFAEEATDKIGKVVPGNPPTVTDFALPQTPKTITGPKWLAVGPGNTIWFAANVDGAAGVAKFSLPADPTTAQGFGGFGITPQTTQGVTQGFDNRMWLLDPNGNGKIIRVDPATGLTASLDINFAAFPSGRGLERGSDGNVYAASFGSPGAIAKIPGSGGTPVEAPTTSPAWDITVGPDGNVYFTMPDGGIGKTSPANITAQTVFKPSDPPHDLFGIAVGGDGALWSPRAFGPDIARMTTGGQFSFVTGLAPNGATAPHPEYIAAGPDNTLWFTDKDANKIGRISGILSSGGGGGGGGTVDTKAPGVSGLGMDDTTVVVGPGATPLTGTAAAKTGTTIRYTLSEKATVQLRFERKLDGRRVKKGKKRICAKPTRKNRKKRKCTRYQLAGTLTRSSKQGKNSVKFSGRIGKKALKRGSYRLVVTATDAAGNKSKAKRLSFRVVKPKRKRTRR
jgi:streptogramin lyase